MEETSNLVAALALLILFAVTSLRFGGENRERLAIEERGPDPGRGVDRSTPRPDAGPRELPARGRR